MNIVPQTGGNTFKGTIFGTGAGRWAQASNLGDVRFGKILDLGKKRTSIAVDLLNLFNANTGTAFQQNYGDGSGYLTPTTILNPRFVKFNVTVDF